MSNEERNILTCENCGETLGKSVKYCTTCGMPVGSKPFEPENIEKDLAELYGPPEIFDDADGEEELVDVIICPNCNCFYLASSKYCPECGMKPDRRFNENGAIEDIQILYGPPGIWGDDEE